MGSYLCIVSDEPIDEDYPCTHASTPSYSDSMHPGDYEKDTEPSLSSELDGNQCARENDVPEPRLMIPALLKRSQPHLARLLCQSMACSASLELVWVKVNVSTVLDVSLLYLCR